MVAAVLCSSAGARATSDGGTPNAITPAAPTTPMTTPPADPGAGAGHDQLAVTQPPPAPDPAEALARSEFELAQRHYDLGRFELAIAHYARAYEAMPLPPFLFNIAQCHRQLGQIRRAAFFYTRYLDLAKEPQNATLARALLREMNEKQHARSEAEKATAQNVARALAPGPDTTAASTPLHRRPWAWAAAGGVVVLATAVAIAAAQPPAPTLGTLNGR